MAGEIKIDTRSFTKKMKALSEAAPDAFEKTGKYFQSITPIRSGNARRKTYYNSRKIHARYPYAKPLDTGWSDQAPGGMSQPSAKYFQKLLNKAVRKI